MDAEKEFRRDGDRLCNKKERCNKGNKRGRSKISLRKYEVSSLFVYSFHCFLLSGNVYEWVTLKLMLQLSDDR